MSKIMGHPGSAAPISGVAGDLEYLRRADAEITAALKGPMPNLQRALLVGDRKDIRAAIAKTTGDAS